MKLQTKSLEVLERTSKFLKSGVIEQTPAWFNVVSANPPVKNLVRQPNFKYRKTLEEQQSILDTEIEKQNKKLKDAFTYNEDTHFYKTKIKRQENDIYRPIKLKFLEDELRNLFYQQHPWELADPKLLIENTGNDAAKQDWSSIIQINKKLDGESVVQRTLYLLKENKDLLKKGAKAKKLSLADAYDIARYEYYQVKMQRELEAQIAKEEAQLYGATFKPSSIEYGFNKEQQVIDQWKADAIEATKKLEASKSSAASGSEQGEGSEEGVVDEEFKDVGNKN